MPLQKKFTTEQQKLIDANINQYKALCALLRDPKIDQAKIQARADALYIMLVTIIQTVYLDLKNTLTDDAIIHRLFYDFFQQQIQSIDPFDTENAKRSLTLFQEQLPGLPKAVEEELRYASNLVGSKIQRAVSEKEKIYSKTCPQRDKYISKLQESKAEETSIDFAQKVQAEVQAKVIVPEANLGVPALVEMLMQGLKILDDPAIIADLNSAILLEQIRLYQVAIITKLLEDVTKTLGLESKEILSQLRLIALRAKRIADQIDSKHSNENSAFIRYYSQNLNKFTSFVENCASPLLKGPLITPAAVNSPMVCEQIAHLLINLQALNAITHPEQHKLFTVAAAKIFVASLAGMVPKTDGATKILKFPIVLNINVPILKLLNKEPLNQEGVLICNAFFKQIEGGIKDFQLPYYISMLSGLQANMTGKGLKKILDVLYRLQERFIDTLNAKDLFAYQNPPESELIDLHEQFASEKVHVDTNLKGFTPADQKFIVDYRLKLDELINTRLAQKRSGYRA